MELCQCIQDDENDSEGSEGRDEDDDDGEDDDGDDDMSEPFSDSEGSSEDEDIEVCLDPEHGPGKRLCWRCPATQIVPVSFWLVLHICSPALTTIKMPQMVVSCFLVFMVQDNRLDKTALL